MAGINVPPSGSGDSGKRVDTVTLGNGRDVQTFVQVTATEGGSTTPVSQPLTDTQLRATDLPVSASVLPLPTGAATETTLDDARDQLVSILAAISSLATQVTLAAISTKLTDGTQKTQLVGSTGNVAVIDASGRTNTALAGALADNGAFTDGSSTVFAGAYILDEVAGTALTENDAAAARIDSKRAQVLVVEDATTRGQRMAVSAAGAITVIGAAGGNAIDSKITDGTNRAAVKAASTTPALTDTALVVTQRDPLPSGSNLIGQVVVGANNAYIGNVKLIDAGGTNQAAVDSSGRQSVTAVIPAGVQLLDSGGVNKASIDSNGNQSVALKGGPTTQGSAPTDFTATTGTAIFTTNASSKERTFMNDSDQDLLLCFGQSVTAASYNVRVRANGGFYSTNFTGTVNGMMAAAIGSGHCLCGQFTG